MFRSGVKGWLAVLVLAVVGAGPQGRARADGPEALEPLLKNVPRFKSRYLEDVSVKAIERRYDDDTGEKVVREEGHQYVANTQRFRLTSFDPATKKRGHMAFLGTPLFIYTIVNKEGTEDYIITNSTPRTESTFFKVCRSEFGVSAPMANRDVSVVDYFRLPGTTVTGSETVDWQGAAAARINVSRKPRPNLNLDESFFFDPSHDWVLRGIETRYKRDSGDTTGKAVTVVTYAEDGQTPKRVEMTSTETGGKPKRVWSVDVVEFTRGAPPESELSFAQFGLPELEGASTGGKWVRFYWLLALSAACALLAVVFRQSRRRSAAVG